MAKFFGKIGFSQTYETTPGVWTETIDEKEYYGEVLTDRRRYVSSSGVNENYELMNSVSVIMDDYASENFFAIKYVVWKDIKWSVTEVNVEIPRLRLTLGGVYNRD